MPGNLSFCLSFIVLRIWLMKYDSIKRRFVKSSSKSRILALVQSMECSLPKTCLVSADVSNRRCRMSANSVLFCGWKNCVLFRQCMRSRSHGREFDILLLVAYQGPLSLCDERVSCQWCCTVLIRF